MPLTASLYVLFSVLSDFSMEWKYTRFVMIQGVVGAFLVRIPVSYIIKNKSRYLSFI